MTPWQKISSELTLLIGAGIWGWSAYRISRDFGLSADKASDVGYHVGACFAVLVLAFAISRRLSN